MRISLNEAVNEAATNLLRAGVAEPRMESALLLAHTVGRDRTYMITHAHDPIEVEVLTTFQELIERRARREPLQYITGHQEFYKLDFEVTPAVLIPRPETEVLVESSLELLKGKTTPLIVDIGTGSGCIAVSLLHEVPDARAIATDSSTAALSVARRNAGRHKVADRLTFLESDCLEKVPREPRCSLIVSNPPYIPADDWKTLQREVRDYEPRAALVSGPDGLATIRRLVNEAAEFLIKDGFFVFEIGFGQSDDLLKMIDRKTWDYLGVREDLQRIPRAVLLRKIS